MNMAPACHAQLQRLGLAQAIRLVYLGGVRRVPAAAMTCTCWVGPDVVLRDSALPTVTNSLSSTLRLLAANRWRKLKSIVGRTPDSPLVALV